MAASSNFDQVLRGGPEILADCAQRRLVVLCQRHIVKSTQELKLE